MIIYISTLVVLLLFSFLELRVNLTTIQQYKMLAFVYVIFVLQVGLRWETGTDWVPYLNHFEETNSTSDLSYTLTGFEIGYNYFVLTIKTLWNNYSVFLVSHALIYYFLIFSSLKKFTPYIFVCIMLFYATTLGYLGSSRQLLAMGICLYALRYVLDKQALKFFALIGIAFLFHTTAILFCVYYFLNRDIKPIIIFSVLVASIIIGKTSIPFTMFSFVGESLGGMVISKVSVYIERFQDMENSGLTTVGFIKRLIFLSVFLFNYKALSEKLSYYKLIFNGYFFGLLIYFLFSSSLLIMVNRGSLYFNIMESLLIASQFLLFNNKQYRFIPLIILFIISVFLLLQSISPYPDLFHPYKGIFINVDLQRFRLS